MSLRKERYFGDIERLSVCSEQDGLQEVYSLRYKNNGFVNNRRGKKNSGVVNNPREQPVIRKSDFEETHVITQSQATVPNGNEVTGNSQKDRTTVGPQRELIEEIKEYEANNVHQLNESMGCMCNFLPTIEI